MTRSDLLTQLAYRLNKNASSLDATTEARLIGFLNQRQRRILSLPAGKQERYPAGAEIRLAFDPARLMLLPSEK